MRPPKATKESEASAKKEEAGCGEKKAGWGHIPNQTVRGSDLHGQKLRRSLSAAGEKGSAEVTKGVPADEDTFLRSLDPSTLQDMNRVE